MRVDGAWHEHGICPVTSPVQAVTSYCRVMSEGKVTRATRVLSSAMHAAPPQGAPVPSGHWTMAMDADMPKALDEVLHKHSMEAGCSEWDSDVSSRLRCGELDCKTKPRRLGLLVPSSGLIFDLRGPQCARAGQQESCLKSGRSVRT